MTINIIDPHIHLFDRSIGDYHWLKSDNPPFWPDKSVIQRDFSISDLTDDLAGNNVFTLSGFIHIEAGFDNDQPWRELEYLESLFLDSLPIDCLSDKSLSNESSTPKPFRTIASIDLLASSESFQTSLNKLQNHQTLIGGRHILDDDAFDILSSRQAQQNFAYLNGIQDFIFELQLPLADQSVKKVMPLLIKTITNNQQLRFVVNHAGFPPKRTSKDIDNKAWQLWQNNITKLAQYSNVFIKCSGMEMVDRQYKMSWFSTVSRFCISKFSIDRVMLASNFPLCLLGNKLGKEVGKTTYASYWQDILESSVIKHCSENEKSALLYHNALRIYQL